MQPYFASDRMYRPCRPPLAHLRLEFDPTACAAAALASSGGGPAIPQSARPRSNDYFGAELTPNLLDGAALDLDPQQRYTVLQPPDELAKFFPAVSLWVSAQPPTRKERR